MLNMKKLKNLFAYNYLDISVFIFIFLLLRPIASLTTFIGLSLLFYLKHKKALLLIIIFTLLSFPTNINKPDTYQGKIIDIKKTYYIVDVGKQNILLYTDKQLNFDMHIEFDGKYKLIESSKTSYGFNFQSFCNKQNIYYQIYPENISIYKKASTLRSIVYNLSDDSFYHKFIFNINSDDDIISNFISCGYCFMGFLSLLNCFTKVFLTKRTQYRINGIFYLFFALFYHLNFSSFRLLLKYLINTFDISYKQKVGLCFSICLVFFPYNALTLKFLFPFIASLISVYGYDKKMMLLCNMLIQSYMFNSLNVILLFTYRYFSLVLGFCYFTAWLSLIVDVSDLIVILNQIVGIFNSFKITGSNRSIVVIILFLLFFRGKYKYEWFITIYLIFLSTGLLFPFASVNYINVGQGDSILISDVLNSHHYLIDTGKPSSYPMVKQFLDARNINKIDILFISHYDSDHCGNIESLIVDYDIERVVDYHFNEIKSDKLTFYDLNDRYFKETNDNSQVIFTKLNKHNFIFTNDAPRFVEKNIIQTYDKLESTYLLVGHHGSNTSTCQAFLASIKPKLAIISSGLNNFYNHPHPEVIKQLKDNDIPFLNTAYDGDITVYITRFFDIILSNSKKIGIIF